jgi:putative ABC transport system permease protein
MKASMYFNYTSRSLLRGGQRTILAIFCVAVGVMAIVSLQLVGQMINSALTGNVRDANGGDLQVTSRTAPFKQSDLSYFTQLKNNGTITDFTPVINSSATTGAAATLGSSFELRIVNPSTYPVVTPPTFVSPSNGSLSSLLKNDQVVVDKNLADQYNKKIGDTLTIHTRSITGSGVTIHVKIAGIITDTGAFVQSNDVMVLSDKDYQAANKNAPLLYDTIDITTVDTAHTNQAVKDIQQKFPIASTQTASQALQSRQQQVNFIKEFLEIAGLLALLIGGVGIVNTMQVLLSRRKIEIAMLKTTGYRRFDLYLLFGLEAGLLGLIGGVVGAVAAIGISYLVRNIVQNTFSILIPFTLDPAFIFGGVAIGLATALIFGLMPIVQAANIRPLNVIRELTEGNRVGSIALTIGLLLLLSILFCALAIIILNNVTLGIGAVYGTFVFLLLLSVFFGLIVFVVSVLPVPERFNLGYLAIIFGGIVVSALLYTQLPTFGALLLFISLMGIVIVVLPRSWKVNTKMALRNIGRQRARTTTTLLALFVGVFTIGLILVLGQDLRQNIDAALANSLNFNVVALANGSDATALQNKLPSIPGIDVSHSTQHTIVSVVPISVDGVPLQKLVSPTSKPGRSNLGFEGTVYLLSGFEGFNVSQGQLPDTSQNYNIKAGHNLTSADANSNDVLLSNTLETLAPLKGHIHVGSTIVFASLDGKAIKSVTVVGFYESKNLFTNFEPMLTTTQTVQAFSTNGKSQSIFYLKIDPAKVGKALNAIGKVSPNITVANFANIGDFINSFINDILLVLITIASLSLLAGVIIIANAVALAMLERRRELGILKSVGYTSRTILGEVLIENGLVGGIGALLAMLLVTLATSLLGRFVFQTGFGVSWYIAIGIIVGIAVLAMLISTLVAWGSVRVRPLEVLRYE